MEGESIELVESVEMRDGELTVTYMTVTLHKEADGKPDAAQG